MASTQHCLLVVGVLLICGSALTVSAARYHSVSVDSVISSKARHCYDPDSTTPAASSGNKLPLHRACSGGLGKAWDNIVVHDSSRLSTILKRSTSPGTMPSAPAVTFPPISSATTPAPAEAPSATIPDYPGNFVDSPEFVVVVGLGTPARPSTLVLDTGSDLSWLQCQPCSGHCHQQHDPIFDPTKSSTYGAVPCGTPMCSFANTTCNSTTCLYTIHYDNGFSTSGTLSQETLTFTASRVISSFVFGCGTTNLGDFGEVDGLLGLGRGHLSLPSQAASSFGVTFSYCLPSSNNSNVPGFFSIGPTAVSNDVQYTAMIRKPEYPSLYFVELVSIDIGGYVLPVPSTVFTSTGTLLDSGTILTYLPPQAYTLLRDRFKFTMQGYKPAPAFDILDTCYDFSGHGTIFMPAISFKFNEGTIFDVGGIITFPDDNQPAIGCLAFVSRPTGMPFSIMGNTQQMSTEVIYDAGAERIGFVSLGCT